MRRTWWVKAEASSLQWIPGITGVLSRARRSGQRGAMRSMQGGAEPRWRIPIAAAPPKHAGKLCTALTDFFLAIY